MRHLLCMSFVSFTHRFLSIHTMESSQHEHTIFGGLATTDSNKPNRAIGTKSEKNFRERIKKTKERKSEKENEHLFAKSYKYIII